MKYFLILFASIFSIACRETPKPAVATDSANPINQELQYPQALHNVLEAHGGLDSWRRQRTLSFTINDEDGAETQTIDLYSRKDKIEGPNYTLGYDGNEVWLHDPDDMYEGDPVFYHNLMFYFYAMPFVTADDGILYGAARDLQFDGKTYPGVSIRYETGVGSSPKDEYYLYFDPETHVMAWLGYTVTYFSDTASEDVHWLRYDDWKMVDGLLLPASITWYNYEGRKIKDPRNTVAFDEINLSEAPNPDVFYDAPAGASEIE